MSGLAIDTTWEPDLCRIVLAGEARLETVVHFDDVAREVDQRGVKFVIIDVGGLEFMDSASIGSLIRLIGDLDRVGGRMVLYSVPRLVGRLIERLGLKQFLIADDEAAARERLS